MFPESHSFVAAPLVGLDGWCEGGLRQQRNDGIGWASMHERLERLESHGTYGTELVLCGHFWLALCTFRLHSHALVVITWREVGCHYMMRLGLTVKRAQLLNTKAQMSSVWAKRCMLMIMCVVWLGMTTPPWWREKVMVYYFITRHFKILQWIKESWIYINPVVSEWYLITLLHEIPISELLRVPINELLLQKMST